VGHFQNRGGTGLWQGPIPPPLVDSPKCARCSLAPVCLPDKTRMLSIPTVEKFAPSEERDGTAPLTLQHTPSASPRLLIAPRDEKRVLYLNTQGYRVGCNDAVLKVKEKDRLVEEVRVLDVCHVALFGNIQMPPSTNVQELREEDELALPRYWHLLVKLGPIPSSGRVHGPRQLLQSGLTLRVNGGGCLQRRHPSPHQLFAPAAILFHPRL
jgi:hypothetical protein